MKVAVLTCRQDPFSIRVYRENVVLELERLGIESVPFGDHESLPDHVDLYWDPRAAGGVPPYTPLRSVTKPIVITVHGAGSFSLPPRELDLSYGGVKLKNIKKLYNWYKFRSQCTTIITVSRYAKGEIENKLRLNAKTITPIYHGVDHSIFKPAVTSNYFSSYLLHISAYQPKKNVDRVIAAYHRLPLNKKPHLLALVPGYPKSEAGPNIELIHTPMNHEKLASLYQGAMGFVFPSLHETFGLPIIEAMACGCPVITSNVTACPEISGNAALLVNPRSIDEICAAMCRLIEDQDLQHTLKEKGLERASQFTWRKSAEKHLEVFERALKEGKSNE